MDIYQGVETPKTDSHWSIFCPAPVVHVVAPGKDVIAESSAYLFVFWKETTEPIFQVTTFSKQPEKAPQRADVPYN